MTARGPKELLCGLGSLVFGLLPLAVAYLQPYSESGGNTGNTSYSGIIIYNTHFHPGFTPNELPYIIAFSAPILGIVIGACVHSLSRGASARFVRWVSAGSRLLLWGATVILAIEAVIGLIDLLGLLLAPSLALGICASLLARDARSGSAQPTIRSFAV
ncbi:MAG TPA: hypothetical protein VKQ30_02350 [Ktedonobacterales bacterium]|nr:hypothetical protein [Ktedonobacterales bacterium]